MTTNFEDDIVISFEDFDMDNHKWDAERFGLDPDFNSRFGVHGSGSNSASNTGVNDPTIAFPVPTVPQSQQAHDIGNLSLDIMLSEGLEISNGASSLSPSSPFHDSSGYSSAEESFSLPAPSVSYQSAPSFASTGTELGYSSGEESSLSIGPGSYPQLTSGNFPFTSQSQSLEDRRPSLAIQCDRIPEPSYGSVAPYTPPPLSSGYTSDTGSLHSLDYLSPQHTHGRRDSLSVPVTVMEPRGRPRFRLPHNGGNRHLPYVHTGRSSSFAGLAPPDLEAMMSPQSSCLNRRPRSSSVISTSSSFNGDVSDSDGYFSSHELSDGYSHYSHSRDPSPAYDSSNEAGSLTSLRRRHDRTLTNDATITGNGYRENVGSAAIVKASTERRKKPARFKCSQANCESTFTTKQNLKNHLNSHLGIKQFACGTCGKTFTTLHVRERHQNTCRTKCKTDFVPPTAEFILPKQESSAPVNLWES